MSRYIHKSHNVTVLLYHLVFPAKYRRAVIDATVGQALREVCLQIEARYQLKFLEIGTTRIRCIFSWAESGVKRNIPGRCGKALAVIGNPGWGDVGWDASGAGGTGAAGRAQGRGAEPAGDRAGARPGGLDDQPRAAPKRPAEGRLPAGARRRLLPGAAAASGRPRARRQARPVRA